MFRRLGEGLFAVTEYKQLAAMFKSLEELQKAQEELKLLEKNKNGRQSSERS